MKKFYFDPTASTSGDGSIAVPFRSWSDIPSLDWQPGLALLHKRGATMIGELRPKVAGTIGNHITLGGYGESTDSWKVDGTGSNRGSIFLNTLAYIDIEGAEVFGSAGGSSAGINALNSHHIGVADCFAHHSRQGFRIDNAWNTDMAGFRFTNIEASDTTNLGFAVICGTLRGGTIHDVLVDGITLRRVSLDGGAAGLSVSTRLTSQQAYDPDFVPYDVWIRNLLLDETGPGYGVIFKYLTRGGLLGSEVTRVSLQGTEESHTVWCGGCRYVVIEGNEIHHNGAWENGTHGAGTAVFLDQGAVKETPGLHGSQHCKVIGNYIHHQSTLPSLADTPGAAVSVYRSTENIVVGNIIEACRYGVSAQGSGMLNTERTLVANNTLIDIEQIAIALRDRANNSIAVNNIIERAGVGIFEESGDAAATNLTRDWNCVHASTRHNFARGSFNAFKNGNETPLPANANDIEADPLLRSDFGIGPDSPCFGTARTVELARDNNGQPLRDPPDRGARQAFTERA